MCVFLCNAGHVWVFHSPPMCCLCLWSTGPPLHCSSSSSSPVEQLPYPPPSIAANQNQGRLLGNCAAQPAQDSDSEDEFGPNSFLVKTGSGNLCASAAADGELVLKLLLLSGGSFFCFLLFAPGCVVLQVMQMAPGKIMSLFFFPLSLSLSLSEQHERVETF